VGKGTVENPLLSACHCTGTMKFVHHNCLKSWLNLKLMHQQNEHIATYMWRTFECEICKTSYPCISFS
jgi:E3 ubiquitin-protein ligase DOA10